MPITPNPYFAQITLEEPATFISIGGDYPVESTMGYDRIEVSVATQDVVIVEIPAVQGSTGAQGIQGIQGVIGPGFLFQGSYSNAITYHLRDVVTYLGSSWVLTSAATLNSTPALNSPDWGVFAEKGDKGDTSATGTGANTTYTHSQGSASTLWNINHNRNRFPSVTVVDSENRIAYGSVTYVDANNLTVAFNYAFAGSAFLN